MMPSGSRQNPQNTRCIDFDVVLRYLHRYALRNFGEWRSSNKSCNPTLHDFDLEVTRVLESQRCCRKLKRCSGRKAADCASSHVSPRRAARCGRHQSQTDNKKSENGQRQESGDWLYSSTPAVPKDTTIRSWLLTLAQKGNKKSAKRQRQHTGNPVAFSSGRSS